MIVLTEADVARLLPMAEAIEVIDAAMRVVSTRGAELPLRSIVDVGGGNRMGVMPGAMSDPACFGIKLISLFPGNPARGLSSHRGAIVLFALVLTLASVGALIGYIHHIPESINIMNLAAKIGNKLRDSVISMLEGVEIHRRYRRDGDRIALEREQTAAPGGVLVLAPRDVHAIANPDDAPSLGVHVYFGDIVGIERTLWDTGTGEAMAFTLPDYERRVTPYR